MDGCSETATSSCHGIPGTCDPQEELKKSEQPYELSITLVRCSFFFLARHHRGDKGTEFGQWQVHFQPKGRTGAVINANANRLMHWIVLSQPSEIHLSHLIRDRAFIGHVHNSAARHGKVSLLRRASQVKLTHACQGARFRGLIGLSHANDREKDTYLTPPLSIVHEPFPAFSPRGFLS